MAQFPANIVTTTNIPDTNPLTTLAANNHSTKHNDMRNEIVAIETYLGKTGSTVAGSVQNILLEITGTDQAVGKTATQSIINKTLSTGTKMALGSDATGDTYYNSGSGTVARRGIGSDGQVMTVVSGVPNWQSPSAGNFNYIADTGVANAYVATLSPALGAYAAGVLVQFKATNANTTASTVNVNGLGVKTIKKLNGSTDLVSGDIAAGMIVELEYDGTNFVMLNPVANAPLVAGSLSSNVGATFLAGENLTAGQPVSSYFYQSDGGVLFDSKSGVAGNISSAGGTHTVALTVGNNANRMLTCFVSTSNTSFGGTAATPTVTYNGVSMTARDTRTSGAPQYKIFSFSLATPTTGTNNLVVTIPSSSATQGVAVAVYSHYNVSGIENFTGANDTGTVSYTAPASGVVLVSAEGNVTGASSANNFNNYQNFATENGSIASGDSGVAFTNGANATVTFTGGGANVGITVIGLTPATAPSYGYVVKSSAATPTNAVNLNKYTTFTGFAQSTVSAGQSVTVTTDAGVSGLSGLTPLSTYYLADTAGTIATTAGTNTKKVGFATSTTALLMKDTI